MDPNKKEAAWFYCNLKVHKQTEHNTIPPVLLIISGSGAVIENISLYLEHHIKETSLKHPSYLQDTPYFLKVLEKNYQGPKLSKNSVLVTAEII